MTADEHLPLRASDAERERAIDVLRAAAGEGRLTLEELDERTGAGDIELLVPDGVIVDVRTSTLAGSVRQQAGISAEPGAPRIILTGETVAGNVIVRARRRRERLMRGRHGKRDSGS